MNRFGHVNEINSLYIKALQLLSNDPIYQQAPLIKTKLLLDQLWKGNYFSEISQTGDLASFLIFYRINENTSKKCVKENRAPLLNEVDEKGKVIFISAVTGLTTVALLRAFFNAYKGNSFLYFRHYKNGQKIKSPSIKHVRKL